jgi:hypothetical protein
LATLLQPCVKPQRISMEVLFRKVLRLFFSFLSLKSFQPRVMGNSFGYLRTSTTFGFTVVDACKAESIDLSKTCSLNFSPEKQLMSIGNVTRDTMKPMPSIAGMGIWFAMMAFFGIIVVALAFVMLEILARTKQTFVHELPLGAHPTSTH